MTRPVTDVDSFHPWPMTHCQFQLQRHDSGYRWFNFLLPPAGVAVLTLWEPNVFQITRPSCDIFKRGLKRTRCHSEPGTSRSRCSAAESCYFWHPTAIVSLTFELLDCEVGYIKMASVVASVLAVVFLVGVASGYDIAPPSPVPSTTPGIVYNPSATPAPVRKVQTVWYFIKCVKEFSRPKCTLNEAMPIAV